MPLRLNFERKKNIVKIFKWSFSLAPYKSVRITDSTLTWNVYDILFFFYNRLAALTLTHLLRYDDRNMISSSGWWALSIIHKIKIYGVNHHLVCLYLNFDSRWNSISNSRDRWYSWNFHYNFHFILFSFVDRNMKGEKNTFNFERISIWIIGEWNSMFKCTQLFIINSQKSTSHFE